MKNLLHTAWYQKWATSIPWYQKNYSSLRNANASSTKNSPTNTGLSLLSTTRRWIHQCCLPLSAYTRACKFYDSRPQKYICSHKNHNSQDDRSIQGNEGKGVKASVDSPKQNGDTIWTGIGTSRMDATISTTSLAMTDVRKTNDTGDDCWHLSWNKMATTTLSDNTGEN